MLTVANKKLISLLAVICTSTAFAECTVQTSSQLVNEYAVSAPYDVVKTKSSGRCKVQFKLDVNGETHSVSEEAHGMEPDEMLCHRAIAHGRSDVLVNLGGKYRTEAINSCAEGRLDEFKPVKIGQSILENDVLPVPGITKYWNYNNTKCRLFRERYGKNGKLTVNHGVICQTDSIKQNWIVVDKW